MRRFKKNVGVVTGGNKARGRNSKLEYPTMFRNDGFESIDKKEIASGFNKYFATVGSKLAETINYQGNRAENSIPQSSKVFKFQEVRM